MEFQIFIKWDYGHQRLEKLHSCFHQLRQYKLNINLSAFTGNTEQRTIKLKLDRLDFEVKARIIMMKLRSGVLKQKMILLSSLIIV